MHDQRGVNEKAPALWHPPAAQPRHRQLARLVLFWQSRYPRIPVHLAKRDIEGAFRLLWLDPNDCELFAGELPWSPEEMPPPGEETRPSAGPDEAPPAQGMVAIYLVLSFGFAGAPGEWMAWAAATTQYHAHFSPGRPRTEGPERFRAEILMDDCVLVEPCLGDRPAQSAEVYEKGVVTLLGEGAINLIKNEEDGTFTHRLTCWGLELDTEEGVIRVPERRILKGAYLLNDPIYDAGNKDLRLLDLQRVRGTTQSWAPVLPALRTELKAVDLFLGPAGPDGRVQCSLPPGPAADRAWLDLWRAFEFLRLLCARPEVWQARFATGLESLLTIRERLALPGARAQMVYVSTDATPEVHAACDWEFGIASRESVQEFFAILADHSDDDEDVGRSQSSWA